MQNGPPVVRPAALVQIPLRQRLELRSLRLSMFDDELWDDELWREPIELTFEDDPEPA